MRIGLVVAVALLGGCATADRVPLENGIQGFAIECPRIAQCYKKAAKLCAPEQYETVDRGQRNQGALINGIGSIATSNNITIVCKKP